LAIEVDFSLPAERVVRSLNQIIEWRGKPQSIRIYNGPEYVSGKLMEWAEKQGVQRDNQAENAASIRMRVWVWGCVERA